MPPRERRTIESWGNHLNVKDEPLTLEEAMLLASGHQNARLEKLIENTDDIRMRLTRIEMFLKTSVPDYDERVRAMLQLVPAPVEEVS